MAKFCGKCGTKLDEKTGLCPKCEKENIAQENVKQKNVVLNRKQRRKEKRKERKNLKKERRTHWSVCKKIRRFLIKLVGYILGLGILILGVIGILTYCKSINVPFISDWINQYVIKKQVYVESVDREVPETDIGNMILYQSSAENIVVEDGEIFINNEILVTIESVEYREKLVSYIEQFGGTIVGELPEIADYQILLDGDYTLSELNEIIKRIECNGWVESASLNYCIKLDKSYTPNDKKWKNEWGKIPNGINWGIEAIDATGAWEYKNEMKTTVNIGLIDDMFDIYHEDLKFTEEPLGNALTLVATEEKKKIEWSDHGTHVSGIMAAKMDNKKGIAGICPKCNLYGVSYQGLGIAGYNSLETLKVGLYYLIATKKCSVVNMSIALDQLTFEASRGGEYALKQLKIYSSGLENVIEKLIDRGYQFVICKGSGNQNEVCSKDSGKYSYVYFKKDPDDTDDPYEYYEYMDYLKYMQKDEKRDVSLDEVFKKYNQEEIEKRLDSGNVDAKFDFLGMIENPKVADRIIMIGEIENLIHTEDKYWGLLGYFGKKTVHDGFKINNASMCGERVDILAPGEDIYSTIRNGYGPMSGTSMATPHVSGVAASIFSINPRLTGEDVKKIICDTATGDYGKEHYGVLNAKKAVETAKNYSSEEQNKKDKIAATIPDAIEFNEHWYKVIWDDTIKDWKSAVQYCRDQNGYLATITTQEENDFLYSYITQEGYSNAYFGLSNEESEGTWIWENGEEVTYTNWHSGEPNTDSSSENYAMFYYQYSDGTWNDGSFKEFEKPFICEWEDADSIPKTTTEEKNVSLSGERDIVLVLDVSGSMGGTPIEETRKASENFINTILDEDANIGLVTYNSSASKVSDFSRNKAELNSMVSNIYSNGGTNIEAGLLEAYSMLKAGNAKKKIIVLMSDGEPNEGKEDEALIEYADEIKNDGIIIYTLGFFENFDNKSYAQNLMEKIASDGCHYEVANADDLVFFFEDIADQINGQKYIYIRIACPVDVTVSYNGERLCSAEKNLNLRTDFGTLAFEENEDKSNGIDDRIKVLRLKEGADYDVQINGTGYGHMNYTIGFMDENGDYNDLRKFRNVKITKKTEIDTVATIADESVLNIDEDGDGKYDLKLRATKNSYGEKVETYIWIYVVAGCSAFLLLFTSIIVIKNKRNKKQNKNKGER